MFEFMARPAGRFGLLLTLAVSQLTSADVTMPCGAGEYYFLRNASDACNKLMAQEMMNCEGDAISHVPLGCANCVVTNISTAESRCFAKEVVEHPPCSMMDIQEGEKFVVECEKAGNGTDVCEKAVMAMTPPHCAYCLTNTEPENMDKCVDNKTKTAPCTRANLTAAMEMNNASKCESMNATDKMACQMAVIAAFPAACGNCMMENMEHPEKCVPAMDNKTAPCTSHDLTSAMEMNKASNCESMNPADKMACQMAVIATVPPACGNCMMENMEHPEKCVPAMDNKTAPCTSQDLTSAMEMNKASNCESMNPSDKMACQMAVIAIVPPACGNCMMENMEHPEKCVPVMDNKMGPCSSQDLTTAMQMNNDLKCESMNAADKMTCQMAIIATFPAACGNCMMNNADDPEKCIYGTVANSTKDTDNVAPCSVGDLMQANTLNTQCITKGPLEMAACQAGIMAGFPPACAQCMAANVENPEKCIPAVGTRPTDQKCTTAEMTALVVGGTECAKLTGNLAAAQQCSATLVAGLSPSCMMCVAASSEKGGNPLVECSGPNTGGGGGGGWGTGTDITIGTGTGIIGTGTGIIGTGTGGNGGTGAASVDTVCSLAESNVAATLASTPAGITCLLKADNAEVITCAKDVISQSNDIRSTCVNCVFDLLSNGTKNLLDTSVWAQAIGTCVTTPVPTCFDAIKNGDEVGPDCGGSCFRCVVVRTAVEISSPAALVAEMQNTYGVSLSSAAPLSSLDDNARLTLASKIQETVVFATASKVTAMIAVVANEPTTLAAPGSTEPAVTFESFGSGVTKAVVDVLDIGTAASQLGITLDATKTYATSAVSIERFDDDGVLMNDQPIEFIINAPGQSSLAVVVIKADGTETDVQSIGGTVESVGNGVFKVTMAHTSTYIGYEPLCTDGLKNGDETGPDCGGIKCGTCPPTPTHTPTPTHAPTITTTPIPGAVQLTGAALSGATRSQAPASVVFFTLVGAFLMVVNL